MCVCVCVCVCESVCEKERGSRAGAGIECAFCMAQVLTQKGGNVSKQGLAVIRGIHNLVGIVIIGGTAAAAAGAGFGFGLLLLCVVHDEMLKDEGEIKGACLGGGGGAAAAAAAMCVLCLCV